METGILANALLAGPGVLQAQRDALYDDDNEVAALDVTLGGLTASLELQGDHLAETLARVQIEAGLFRYILRGRTAEDKRGIAVRDSVISIAIILKKIPLEDFDRAAERTIAGGRLVFNAPFSPELLQTLGPARPVAQEPPPGFERIWREEGRPGRLVKRIVRIRPDQPDAPQEVALPAAPSVEPQRPTHFTWRDLLALLRFWS